MPSINFRSSAKFDLILIRFTDEFLVLDGVPRRNGAWADVAGARREAVRVRRRVEGACRTDAVLRGAEGAATVAAGEARADRGAAPVERGGRRDGAGVDAAHLDGGVGVWVVAEVVIGESYKTLVV